MKKCEKIGFSSAEEAQKEILRQLETQQRPWASRDTKNCRRYLCPHCSTEEEEVWHLTSQPTIITY